MRKIKRGQSPFGELIDAAERALDFSYAPYSHFQVGAALRDQEGHIWTGCNIENAAFSPGTCAERTALYKAVSEGAKHFSAIAIVGRHEGDTTLTDSFTAPCGVCRQALNEFCDASLPVILANSKDDVEEWTLGELLPGAFGSTDLNG